MDKQVYFDILVIHLIFENSKILKLLSVDEPKFISTARKLYEDGYLIIQNNKYEVNSKKNYLMDKFRHEYITKEYTMNDLEKLCGRKTFKFTNSQGSIIEYSIFNKGDINKAFIKYNTININELYKILNELLRENEIDSNRNIPKITTIMENINKYLYLADRFDKREITDENMNQNKKTYEDYVKRHYL